MIEHTCDCSTPWDPSTPPTMLLVDKKNHPPHQTWQLPYHGYRAQADNTLTRHGYQPPTNWEPTTHTWNPNPDQPGPKNRPALTTQLRPQDTQQPTTAIIDTPNYTGPTGHHCPDCHANFADQQTAQTHKPTWRHQCRHPSSIRNILTGQPLLRYDGAVWHYNRDSCWPNGHPDPGPLLLGETLRATPPEQRRVYWRYGVRCYGWWVAKAVDFGIAVGDDWYACNTCPGRGDGHCERKGALRP